MNNGSDEIHAEAHEEKKRSDDENVKGAVVTDSAQPHAYGTMEETTATDTPVSFSTSWKMNIVLAFICCWFAMVLTSWGQIQSGGSVANPLSGKASMWMVISSQWLILLLYLWTLVAPKLFPDRDFS